MSLDPTEPTAEHLAAILTQGGVGATPVIFAQEYAIVTWALAVAKDEAGPGLASDAIDHALAIFATITAQLDTVFAAGHGV